MAAEANLLKDTPLFQAMEEAERVALAGLMEARYFPCGTTLFHERDPGGICYVLRRGRVELSVRDELNENLHLATLEEGELFGELSLLDGGLRSSTARAVEDVEVLALRRGDFIAFLKAQPEASLHILAALTHRLRTADLLLKRRVQDPNKIIDERITVGQRISDAVASFGGSWSFILTFLSGLVLWIVYNSLFSLPYDPYPFILLNLILSMVAALQAPVIMMSQNRQDAKDRIRSEADYQVNLKAEAGVQQLHEKIDRMRAELYTELDALSMRLPRS